MLRVQSCCFALSTYSFADVFVVAGNFGWQLREGMRKSSGASCSKDGECCPLEKSPSSLWCNYFPQLLTLHLNWELLSFWKYRDLEDPLDPKDLEDHVVNRYCKPIHYLWYIFLSPAAWLDAVWGGNIRSFLSCSKPSFSFFEGVARRSGTLRIIPPLYFRCLRSICIWW